MIARLLSRLGGIPEGHCRLDHAVSVLALKVLRFVRYANLRWYVN